jgi:hypothetical protein
MADAKKIKRDDGLDRDPHGDLDLHVPCINLADFMIGRMKAFGNGIALVS